LLGHVSGFGSCSNEWSHSDVQELMEPLARQRERFKISNCPYLFHANSPSLT
jgi:hypothetical protein